MRSATRSRAGKDREYLEWVHTLKCVVGFECWGKVQAHHSGERGMSQRAPDRTALPLCELHHSRLSPVSIHTLGKPFWSKFGIDKQALIERLNKQFDERTTQCRS